MNSECAAELELLLESGWSLIAVESFEEDRALEMIGLAASRLGRELVPWSLASGLGGTGKGALSLDDGIRAISFHPEPAVFALLDAHLHLEDRLGVRRLRDAVSMLGERMQAVVLVGPVFDLPPELARDVAIVELPLPRAPELHDLFHASLPDADPGFLERAVRAATGLTAQEAVRVFRKAVRASGALDDGAVSIMVREKRQALRRTPALSFHEGATGMEEVGGLGELKRWLRDRRRAFGEEARNFGLPEPRGLLLLGVQGCGKSLCAKAVASEWQFPLLRLDLAAAFGDPGRSPEATVREACAIAESLAPAVLWIDEIEKGFAASESDPRATRIFGSFLTWLSEKRTPVFVVATANDVGHLPPELLRRGRFDELFFVDLPTAAERADILAIHLRKRGRDPLQFDLEDLAAQSERLSGAELEQVVTAALYTAFAERRDLTDPDLANAMQETVPLYDTYEERIKELRDWARHRARPATLDARVVNLFDRR